MMSLDKESFTAYKNKYGISEASYFVIGMSLNKWRTFTKESSTTSEKWIGWIGEKSETIYSY